MTNMTRLCAPGTSGQFALAAAFAASFSAWAPAASGDPAVRTDKTQYAALQSFSREYGSKSTSGYFVNDTGKCFVTLTIAKKETPEKPAGEPPDRISLLLNPGQMAGLDEEGQSVTFTCGKNAAALTVINIARAALMASQKPALSNGQPIAIEWDVYRQW